MSFRSCLLDIILYKEIIDNVTRARFLVPSFLGGVCHKTHAKSPPTPNLRWRWYFFFFSVVINDVVMIVYHHQTVLKQKLYFLFYISIHDQWGSLLFFVLFNNQRPTEIFFPRLHHGCLFFQQRELRCFYCNRNFIDTTVMMCHVFLFFNFLFYLSHWLIH